MRSLGARHCLTGPIIKDKPPLCISAPRLMVLHNSVLKLRVFALEVTRPLWLINENSSLLPCPNKVCTDEDILRDKLADWKGWKQNHVKVPSECIALKWPHCGILAKCNSHSIKRMRRGRGNTALNLHLQVHQGVILMNLYEGQGRWGDRRKDQRDGVCAVWKDWHFLFALIRTKGNHFKPIQKYTHPLVWSFCAFSLPQTFWMIKQKPHSQERCCKTSQTLQSKENSIRLIRQINTNNECAKAKLGEKYAKRKTRYLSGCACGSACV